MSGTVIVAVGRARRGPPFALERAAREALAGLSGQPARAALVLVPWAGVPHPDVPARVRAVVGDVPLAGGSVAGAFGAGRRTDDELRVVLFGGEGLYAGCGLSPALGDTPETAVSEAVAAAVGAAADRAAGAALDGSPPALLLAFLDPLAADLRRVAVGAAGTGGAPLLAIGTATGLPAETRPLSVQLGGSEAVCGGVAVLALVGPGLRAATAAFTGEVGRGRPLEVTAVSGRRLTGLDDQPALSAWSGGRDSQPHALALVPPDEVAAPAGAVPPLLPVWGTDAADGALVTAAALRPGETVACVRLDLRRAAAQAAEAVPRAVARLGGRPLLALCCADPGDEESPVVLAGLLGAPLVGVRTSVTLVRPADGQPAPGGVPAPGEPLAHALSVALLVEAA